MTNLTWEEEQELQELEQGLESKRILEFPMGIDGPVLYVRLSQPYGMYEFATEKGPVPKELEGQWTDLGMIKMAGQIYVDKTVSPAKLNPKGEPAKIKDLSATQRTITRVEKKAM